MAGDKFIHGLCGCSDNDKNCCLGTFCSPCLACSNAERLGGSGWMYLVLSCLFPCVAMCLLRGRARSRLGETGPDGRIGDGCRHCLAGFFCTPCVNCQVKFEGKLMKDPHLAQT